VLQWFITLNQRKRLKSVAAQGPKVEFKIIYIESDLVRFFLQAFKDFADWRHPAFFLI
jgi:hypothetical protein